MWSWVSALLRGDGPRRCRECRTGFDKGDGVDHDRFCSDRCANKHWDAMNVW